MCDQEADRQAVFNVDFSRFANHYEFHPRLCPPYAPWVKEKWSARYITSENASERLLLRLPEKANHDVLAWLPRRPTEEYTHLLAAGV